MHKDSMPLSFNSTLFRRRCGISDLTYIIRPPLEEVLSCLNRLYPCALNCASGKLSSSLDSLMARKSTLWLDKSSCKCANLCLKLLMFTCVNTKLWRWVCLKSDMILKKPPVSFSKTHSFSVRVIDFTVSRGWSCVAGGSMIISVPCDNVRWGPPTCVRGSPPPDHGSYLDANGHTRAKWP